jgi:hypothetical protein
MSLQRRNRNNSNTGTNAKSRKEIVMEAKAENAAGQKKQADDE